VAKAEEAPVGALVDHLFRHQAGAIAARLVRLFGAAHLDASEDAIQDALVEAVRRWPHDGIPERPDAWLTRVARNRLLDHLRRRRSFDDRQDRYALLLEQTRPRADGERFPGEVLDDQLALIFACCTPLLKRPARVALTLKIACGFSVEEIAAAFLDRRATVAQRLVRAKAALRAQPELAQMPPPDHIPDRLDAVLEVLLVMFNEGYSAHQGEALVRHDLCHEALRLVRLLLARRDSDRPRTRALAALFCLQASRLGARLDEHGTSLLLADQDRSRWDRSLIQEGFAYLEAAENANGEPSPYHLMAAIAACHAAAPAPEAVDWVRILKFYDALTARFDSGMVRLNRIIALAEVHGPDAALEALDTLDDETLGHHLYAQIARADLLERSGRTAAALACWRGTERLDLRRAQRLHVEERIRRLERES